jgi:hypothetical protein
MLDGRHKVQEAREKLDDNKFLWSADNVVGLEKQLLEIPRNSVLNMIFDGVAHQRKSSTSLSSALWTFLEFGSLFIPGPVGFAIRTGMAAIDALGAVKDYDLQNAAFTGGLYSYQPSTSALNMQLYFTAGGVLVDAAMTKGLTAPEKLPLPGSGGDRPPTSTLPPVDKPPVNPVEPSVNAVDPTVKPADPVVKPADPPVKPADPPVHPADPTTPPKTEGTGPGTTDVPPSSPGGPSSNAPLKPIKPAPSKEQLPGLRAARKELAEQIQNAENAIADIEQEMEEPAAKVRRQPKEPVRPENTPEAKLKRLKDWVKRDTAKLQEIDDDIKAAESTFKSTGELNIPAKPTELRGTRMKSWNPDVYIGTYKGGFRDNVETLLLKDQQGPLSQKLLRNGEILPANVGDPTYWKAHPEIFEAGHVRSANVGDKDVLVLMSKWRNEVKFGYEMEQTGDIMLDEAYVIQGIAVDRGTAWDLGFDKKFLDSCQKIKLSK